MISELSDEGDYENFKSELFDRKMELERLLRLLDHPA
jgi:hypothetical protein